ncbi:uncharacterized protein O9250_009898 isoform 1-T1 [Rhynochetos jubatus]
MKPASGTSGAGLQAAVDCDMGEMYNILCPAPSRSESCCVERDQILAKCSIYQDVESWSFLVENAYITSYVWRKLQCWMEKGSTSGANNLKRHNLARFVDFSDVLKKHVSTEGA